MKVIHKAIKKSYRFNCPGCGSILEATSNELRDVGGKASKYYCPICSDERYITWSNLRSKVIYEDVDNK